MSNFDFLKKDLESKIVKTQGLWELLSSTKYVFLFINSI